MVSYGPTCALFAVRVFHLAILKLSVGRSARTRRASKPGTLCKGRYVGLWLPGVIETVIGCLVGGGCPGRQQQFDNSFRFFAGRSDPFTTVRRGLAMDHWLQLILAFTGYVTLIAICSVCAAKIGAIIITDKIRWPMRFWSTRHRRRRFWGLNGFKN